ncbi:rhamnogalacturonan acetylesterase [Galbibacter sp. EGI 63066]|uniref:rhamnogalacturonan acetylesterase n=1 Tax=Galbibacter sp. EGI 63066 TaxID=2993559 RepID=UPI00224925F0|nr:rhamnogalacturonan acetylesterase [Galbibacter sp. EGI 63066]MCX2680503.1 rhamnogalacturonan acetylesterase [Galbibacter sp. EGI 63066]
MKKIKLFMIVMALLPLSYCSQSKSTIVLHLAGDSTMANKPYTPSNPEKGWGQVLSLYVNEGLQIGNHAVNGRSTKSFRDEGRWQQILDVLNPGDYVLIQFGHNDQKEKSPERYAEANTDYRENLIRFVEEVREKQGNPILATSIVRRKFEDGELKDTHGDYTKVVREVASELDVPLLDLEDRTREMVKTFGEERSKQLYLHYLPGEYERFQQGKEDNTHLSPTGAFKVCDLAVEELKKHVPGLEGYFKE